MYVSTLTLVFRLLSCHTLKKTSKNINLEKELDDDQYHHFQIKQLSRSYQACALRALGLLLADGTPTVGGGKTF